ncbi:TetR-like C-terminal domain-containing protein [Streptomyces lateritius]|uniref:TetR-like C-terminal domain-containing protein n=1 Tax=Streptomyces lateritius TaxID=67313 RepID=UPI002892EF3D|nr:TetR-like C-terminal domain-containing protein [Streptomyces lateritius]
MRDAVPTGLAEHGYPALTVEYVAEHSGVHKTTLPPLGQRRGTARGRAGTGRRGRLDASGHRQPRRGSTGSHPGGREAFGDHAEAAAPTAFVGAAFQSPRAAEALHGFSADRFGRCEVVVTQSRRPGRGAETAGAVVRAVSAPLFLRLFITREPIDGEVADRTARAVLAAVDAGAYVAE